MTIILIAIYAWLFYELWNAPLLDENQNPVNGLRFHNDTVSLYKNGHRVIKMSKELFNKLTHESHT